jgi:taurine dioxygenase
MMKINKLSNSGLGIEITDIDLTKPLNEKNVNIIRNLWLNYSVAVFPNQELSHFEFENFSLSFGDYGVDSYLVAADSNHPHVMEIRREADEKTVLFGGTWHSDWSFQRKPPSATLLHSKIIPPIGGDTLFCNNIKAYEDLPEDIKENVSGLSAVHSAKEVYGDDGFYANEDKNEGRSIRIKTSKSANKKISHPIVINHSETGKKALFVNPVYSVGVDQLSAKESNTILKKLYDHIFQEKYIYRHKWEKNMLIMWDNRSVMHRVDGGFEGYQRLMHRITIK